MSDHKPAHDPAHPSTRRRRENLSRVAESLRALHKLLMEEARRDYEKERGPVPSPAALLQLLMTDESFAWLRPLSGAMVELDELLDLPAPAPEQAARVRIRFEAMVTDDGDGPFGARYREYLQRSADVVMAHAAVRIALRPL